MTVDDEYLDENDRFHIHDANLIMYSHGEYFCARQVSRQVRIQRAEEEKRGRSKGVFNCILLAEISNRNLRRSCMKKMVCTMLCIMLLFGLSACGGDVSEVKTHNVESESYSEEDIKAAIDTIKKEFKSDWKGCTLTEIYYAGDDCTKDHKDWADRNNADEVIVLLSSFDVDSSGGDGSLNPNSTYSDWKWILVRTDGGKWQHVDHGY